MLQRNFKIGVILFIHPIQCIDSRQIKMIETWSFLYHLAIKLSKKINRKSENCLLKIYTKKLSLGVKRMPNFVCIYRFFLLIFILSFKREIIWNGRIELSKFKVLSYYC